jgi:hypothetical protein
MWLQCKVFSGTYFDHRLYKAFNCQITNSTIPSLDDSQVTEEQVVVAKEVQNV